MVSFGLALDFYFDCLLKTKVLSITEVLIETEILTFAGISKYIVLLQIKNLESEKNLVQKSITKKKKQEKQKVEKCLGNERK